jgi:hypothetical protein
MKKVSLLLPILLLWGAVSVNAQVIQITKARKAWVDFQIAHSYGFNDWNRLKFASDRLPGTSSTDLRATINVCVIQKTVGIFHDIGVGIMPAPREGFSDPAAQAALFMGAPFHTKEITVEEGNQSASAHFKMTFGVFGKISISDKFAVSPRFGVGFTTMSAPTCEAVLKEHDSNMQYTARYQWLGMSKYDYDNSASLGYLAYRLCFSYQVSPKLNLLFGLEYTWHFTRADFSETYTNYFNHNITRTNHYRGNQLNMMGLSVGISF